MKPANDPAVDYRALVQRGYDQCAAAYESARRASHRPELALLLERLADGAIIAAAPGARRNTAARAICPCQRT